MTNREIENEIDTYKKLALIYSRALDRINNEELQMLLEESIEGCFQAIEYLESSQACFQPMDN